MIPELRFNDDTTEWVEDSLGTFLTTENTKNNGQYDIDGILSVSDSVGVVNQMEYQGRSFAGASIDNYKVVKDGQIIYTKSPLGLKPFGTIKVVHNIEGVVSPLYVVNNASPECDPDCIYYLFDTPERTNDYLRTLVHVGAKHTMNISDAEWLSGKVSLPKKHVQTEIATLLSDMDAKIKAQSEKVENLKQIKASMLVKMFPQEGQKVPEIRFDGFSGDWDEKPFGEVFVEYTEKNHTELPTLTIVQGIGTVRRNECGRVIQFDESNLSGYKLVRKGNFIVHLRSFEGGLEIANSDGIVSPAYHILEGHNAYPSFYYPYLRSDVFIAEKITPHVYGVRDGRSIELKELGQTLIPNPSMDEQILIGNFFDSLNEKITLETEKLDKFTQIKKALLNKLLP